MELLTDFTYDPRLDWSNAQTFNIQRALLWSIPSGYTSPPITVATPILASIGSGFMGWACTRPSLDQESSSCVFVTFHSSTSLFFLTSVHISFVACLLE
ncbi:unnamed protein product [Microthlaspi erraticum]|uniref:Uncharacterized protein n=1 Tax=Microthlaspi erraticum TaxID=1685480 RepID=A0A6D2LMA1_9BRAS|nr:unnamed protein product [Microthlaspi erraticum]